MPQYQELGKGYARVKVDAGDATRAYVLLMSNRSGRMQVLPGDVYVIAESLLPVLQQNNIRFEVMEIKPQT